MPGARLARFLTLLLVVGWVAGVAVQVPQKPTFRSGVEMVVIDVNVVDEAARPVQGLKPEDFAVSVDHKPRTILSVQYVEYGVRLVQPKGRSGGASMLEALAAPTRLEQTGRNVVIVVDDDSLETITGLEAAKAARAFLDKLPPNDRVAVATIPRLQGSLTFTSDRTAARKMLESIITSPHETMTGEYRIGLREALEMDRGDTSVIESVMARECRCSYGANPVDNLPACDSTPDLQQCKQAVLMQAHQGALQSRMHAQRSLDALREMAVGLGQIEGPKTVVLVSGGLGTPETSSSFNPLEPAMAAGQVSLYTLYIEQSSFQARNPLPPSVEDDREYDFGLENATAAAGGTLVRVIGRIESAFDRVATEMSGGYLIGIEVTASDRDGRTHDVQVKVKRSGVEVRARRRYVIEPEKPAAKRADSTAPGNAPRRVRIERPPMPAPEASAVTPELIAFLTRATDYVTGFESAVPGYACDEQYDQTLSRWKLGQVLVSGRTTTKEDWFLDKRRKLLSEYVLLKAPVPTGWLSFRDVLQSDGTKVRERMNRLAQVFAAGGLATLQKAQEIMNESVKFNIGFGQRNMDMPTLALVVLDPANRARFFLRKEAEVTVDGVPAWQLAYQEIGSPTLFVGTRDRNFPLEGRLWIDANLGRVLRTTLHLAMDENDADISVEYKRVEELGGAWVPVEMQETYTSETLKLECVSKYSNFRPLGK